MPGITIGEGAVVSTGSLVVRDVAPNTLVAGVPARFVRNLEPDLTNAESIESAIK
jgi:acetyltransferase-like isoleucine patch superfamily enzyme